MYIGQTRDLDRRIQKHNSGFVKSTKSGRPWVLIAAFLYDSRTEAMHRERKLKNLKSQKRVLSWIHDHLSKACEVGPDIVSIMD